MLIFGWYKEPIIPLGRHCYSLQIEAIPAQFFKKCVIILQKLIKSFIKDAQMYSHTNTQPSTSFQYKIVFLHIIVYVAVSRPSLIRLHSSYLCFPHSEQIGMTEPILVITYAGKIIIPHLKVGNNYTQGHSRFLRSTSERCHQREFIYHCGFLRSWSLLLDVQVNVLLVLLLAQLMS